MAAEGLWAVRDWEGFKWWAECRGATMVRLVRPAGSDGFFMEWSVNNDPPHRIDGPARVYDDGRVEWWFKGVRYTDGTFRHTLP